jgi:hypothetical protein
MPINQMTESLSHITPDFACRCLNVRVRCNASAQGKVTPSTEEGFFTVSNAESFSIQHSFMAKLSTQPPWTIVACRLCPIVLDLSSSEPVPVLQIATQQTSNGRCMLVKGNLIEKEEVDRLMATAAYSTAFCVCLPEQGEFDPSLLESKLHGSLNKTLTNHLVQKKLEAEERIAVIVEKEQIQFDELASQSQHEMESLLNSARLAGTLGATTPSSPSLSRQNSTSQLTGRLRVTPITTNISSLALGVRSMSFENVAVRPSTPESTPFMMGSSFKVGSLSRAFQNMSHSPGGTTAYSFSPPRTKGMSGMSGNPRFARGPILRDQSQELFDWEAEPGAPAPISVRQSSTLSAKQVDSDSDVDVDEYKDLGTSMPITIPEGFSRRGKADSDDEDGKMVPPHIMSYKASLKERGDFVVPESLSRRAAFQT